MASTDLKLGQLIDEHQQRDAIHIAVAPVVATCTLNPGQDIGFMSDGGTERVGKIAMAACVGIVDPFLRKPVNQGERFWMFLYPNTITSLRHEWTHPAFGAEKPANDRESKAFSENCLRMYAARMNIYDEPDAAFARLIEGLRSGELFSHGSDLSGLGDLDDHDDLKLHAERFLGITINWSGFTFSCSC